MFRASSVLPLRDDLHHAFDRLYLSLYVKLSSKARIVVRAKACPVYEVHLEELMFRAIRYTFIASPPSCPVLPNFAAKPSRRAGFAKPGQRPNATLLHWYYSQCVKARKRGLPVWGCLNSCGTRDKRKMFRGIHCWHSWSGSALERGSCVNTIFKLEVSPWHWLRRPVNTVCWRVSKKPISAGRSSPLSRYRFR